MSALVHVLGPRPRLTLVVQDARIAEIWVDGRAPQITLQDYDWGETDPDAMRDSEGFPFTPINWKDPAWALGLSLYPPEQEDNPMAQPVLKTIPIDQLHISKLNMRHGRKSPDVSDILPSIREKGIRQTLLVRPEEDGYGVVAGRRRFHALQVIAAETGKPVLVPCAIMEADDDAAAVEASLIENVARLPATEMEQYNAFGKLAHAGRTVDEIAGHFGVTDLKVRRILALANLSSPIRSLYAKDEIDPETIRALTLATKAQQADWLALFRSETERAPMGRACKAWVTGGSTITTDKALFDLATYDGRITTDLFGETGVFADADTFWNAQSAALAARIETYTDAGWREVQVLERGKYFASWDHVKRSRSRGGSVIVEVRHDGTVTFHEGYITQAEARKRDQPSRPGDTREASDVKPEMSGPLAQYIGLHRHGAARATLLGHPEIALRLMVAHAIVGSALWTVRRHECLAGKDDIKASVTGSRASVEMTAAGDHVRSLFEAHGVSTLRANGDAYHLCQVFAALLGMDDTETMAVLSFVMADTLEACGPTVEAVAVATDTDMAAYWHPEPVFLDLVRDKRAINAMVGGIASPATAKAALTDTGKAQKDLIWNRIVGEGCEANPDWRPGWMQVPPTRLVTHAGSPPADAWARIASLFTSDATEMSPEDAPVAEQDAA
ncbi:MAG: ParB/RepB/Spo0J family partition protein [Alphaproteobacteria bacterium]|nr:ParB/RepB/Spo0J family partition protein [Alphaproteobacteria bacterium]MBU2082784.1 ParB/RepB/Spo0J family partition protein [Alphaproteobacteria bacterium]MBU2143798.1 ParB/RepB/Spo0J family partition protein [Alphaproteobacteria bacterium]MBU2196093.1 ParB/RepB/Spo0J family partition protein [Alphaproteobacteria bacterium]